MSFTLSIKISYTVNSFSFLKYLLWNQYSGMLALFLANSIATVSPCISYKSDLWRNSFGGAIPFAAKSIATVYSSLSVI